MKTVIKRQSCFSACVCWRTRNQSCFCRDLYVAISRATDFLQLLDWEWWPFYGLKSIFFVALDVLNQLVLKPFAPVCFLARGTALWPPSANGPLAHRPVCQVTLPPHNLGKNQKNSDPLRQISWPRWANRFISAVLSASGILPDVEVFGICDTDVLGKSKSRGVSDKLVRNKQEQPESEDGFRAQGGENHLRRPCIWARMWSLNTFTCERELCELLSENYHQKATQPVLNFEAKRKVNAFVGVRQTPGYVAIFAVNISCWGISRIVSFSSTQSGQCRALAGVCVNM